jgi:ABC-2 type transport system permease protein
MTTSHRTAIDERVRGALASGTRPARASALSASLTHSWRVLIGFRHAPEQLFESIVMPFMFLLMFTYLFGGAIAGSSGNYLRYFLPGILVMTVLLMTVNAGTALNAEIAKGIFDRYRTLPYWQPATIVGALVGDFVRYTFAILTSVVLGLVLGFRPAGGVTGVVLALLMLLVIAFSVGWVFTTLGLVVRTADSLLQTGMIVLFPLCFISNIFTFPETMPGWMEAVVDVNPVSHAATAVRGLLHGDATGAQVGWVLVGCAVLTLVFAPLTMRLYRNKR